MEGETAKSLPLCKVVPCLLGAQEGIGELQRSVWQHTDKINDDRSPQGGNRIRLIDLFWKRTSNKRSKDMNPVRILVIEFPAERYRKTSV